MNLIVFLIEEFNIKNIAAAQISNIVNGVVNMLPIVAAILADSYFGNVPVIAVSAFVSLTVQTNIRNLKNKEPSSTALKTDEDLTSNTWRLCSVQEVEDFKAVLRLLPLWAAVMFLSTPVAVQMSMTVLQALVVDRELGPHFKVSAGSLQVIVLLSGCVFIMLNNWTIYPMYQKLIRKPLTPLKQVGIGHVFTILSMAVSAIVEAKRLKTVDNGHPMSVLWLVPALVLVGIGEAFHFPANIAVFYGEFPESLRNTATSLTSVVIGISFYLSTALIDVIQRTTGWLPDDINHGRVDNVYWVLVIGGVLNFGYFLVCSWLYKYRNLKENDSTTRS
ncbi:hypothetical protein CARUB_v10017610mg [Capsella rubella]|uniref:Major facilitator superfamily (MFS) profile domain-containing protein n=1 Tax=Capsella rubella TaxID=81985 RepID=R0FPC8_9BRAS|nr:hypothetical protein CARUB_v10017610mg [Capsella rubella]